MKQLIQEELVQAHQLLYQFMLNDDNLAAIEKAATIMIESIKAGGKIIACGNGGSMCDAMHFCSELTGQYRKRRESIPAIAINDPSYLACVGNDMGYTATFARYVSALGKSGDVLLALTTSGNSANVYTACYNASENRMKVITITGKTGGDLCNIKEKIDVMINIPHEGTADRTQEVTIKVLHILVMLIERGLGYA